MARMKLFGALRPRPTVSANPHSLEVWFWGFCMFMLTGPFMFNLSGVDPQIGVTRNLITMSPGIAGSALAAYEIRLLVTTTAIVLALPYLSGYAARALRFLPVLLLVMWMFASATWTDALRTTVIASLMMSCLVISAVCIAIRLPPNMFARAFVYSGVFMAFFTILWVVALPRFGVHQADDASQSVHAGAWRGVFLHKNGLGQAAAVYFTLVVCCGREVLNPLLKIALAALMLFIIVKSDCSSAWLIIAVAPVLVWGAVCLSAEQRMMALWVAGPILITGVLGASTIMALLGRDMTFSGRTAIWSVAPHVIARSPLLGYGYESRTYGDFSYRVYQITGLVGSHNGYLEMTLGLGLIGLGLFAYCIFTVWRKARRMYEAGGTFRSGGVAIFAVTAAWLVANMSEEDMKAMAAVASLGYMSFGMLLYRLPGRVRIPDLPKLKSAPARRPALAHSLQR